MKPEDLTKLDRFVAGVYEEIAERTTRLLGVARRWTGCTSTQRHDTTASEILRALTTIRRGYVQDEATRARLLDEWPCANCSRIVDKWTRRLNRKEKPHGTPPHPWPPSWRSK